MLKALADQQLDAIGLARPLVLDPNCPKALIEGTLETLDMALIKTGLPWTDRSCVMDIVWYSEQIRRLSQGHQPATGDNKLMRFLSITTKKSWDGLKTRLQGRAQRGIYASD